jgi:hypothetical protein
LRVGILEILIPEAAPDRLRRLQCRYINRHYASIMPQAVSYWSRCLGHETYYATYWGQADAESLLPRDLDVVFFAACTNASTLAYALVKRYRSEGCFTVLGGAHAKAFPEDALRFFDLVVRECDRTLVTEILADRPRGEVVSSPRPLTALPTVAERLPEIETAHFWRGRAGAASFIPLLASLGCPYSCDFCIDWDSRYRLTPLDQLEEDLRFISDRFPRAKIPFHDPNFAIKFDLVLGVMERIPETRRNAYMIESSLSILRDSRLPRLRDTRCAFLAPGVESWNDYAGKTRLPTDQPPRQKLDYVVERFRALHEYVPGLQANFIFGVDSDSGTEPIELSKEFMDRAPGVWPSFNIPTPFGGTPMHDQLLAEGRVLRSMPFAFYYTPYLVAVLRHYDAEHFYDHLIDLFSHLVSPRSVARRARVLQGIHHSFHALRVMNARRMLRHYRLLRDGLRADQSLRRFHAGERSELPAIYRDRLRLLLGRYSERLSPSDLRPRFGSARSSRLAPLPVEESFPSEARL